MAARDYAYSWWNKRNPTYSTYYAEKEGCNVANSSCWSKWNDCTNFVSQAIYAGGMKFRTGSHVTADDAWKFGPLMPTHTWGGAQNFYKHWSQRAGVASSVAALQTGDAVNADFGADGHVDHTAIITKNTGNNNNNKFLTQHTTDKKETSTLQDWYTAGYKVYGYEMDKATNTGN
ncbi:amidase domain-containing protein [Paenibacillus cucumis (ex Kampfer et al. 2016)]|uniref:amidase domain-containing protein n=1 Tax=Paenibacillus cucumis (ex Kampfer et al. 2016) TaxID=1776858 RepID=UPI0028A162CE|nr:amidase domain-containing protein [Paenibacillus cucumis (ex Kampfer et al. 2016)]